MEVLVIILKVIAALVVTIFIEGFVLYKFKERRKKVYVGMLLMNLLTNVPLNIYTLITIKEANPVFTILIVPAIEIGIAIIEGFIYYFITKQKKRSIVYGIFCNAYSYILGGLLYWTLFAIVFFFA